MSSPKLNRTMTDWIGEMRKLSDRIYADEKENPWRKAESRESQRTGEQIINDHYRELLNRRKGNPS